MWTLQLPRLQSPSPLRNSCKLRPGWGSRSLSLLLALCWLGSSHVLASAPEIQKLGAKSKGALDQFSSPFLLLITAAFALGVTVWLGLTLISLLNQNRD